MVCGVVELIKFDDEGNVLSLWDCEGSYRWYLHIYFGDGTSAVVRSNGGYIEFEPSLAEIKKILSILSIPCRVHQCTSRQAGIMGKVLYETNGMPNFSQSHHWSHETKTITG